jgi:CubicO group peptidase (beta-lactamase class C family)
MRMMNSPVRRRATRRSRRGIAFATALFFATEAWCAPASASDPRPGGEEVARGLRSAVERDRILSLAPGLGIVVVKDGRIIYLEGFGLADTGSGRRVDPERTRFRIGSVTKVFTAIEALALAEKGKLGLKDDIARYLPGYGSDRPIRVEDLFTHSAGFDETILGYTPKNPGGEGLAEYLRDYRPALLRAPGLISQYSNYGVALAGAVEGKAAGRPYEECVVEDILSPLGMLSSGFEPSPNTAVGHEARGSAFIPVPYGAIADTPDGGMETTCADMGLFLVALMEGPAKGSSALSPASHRELLSPRFRNPGAPTGVALCIQEELRGGRHFLEHQGGLPEGHVAYLALYPDEDMGIFVAANALSPAAARVVEAFESMLPKASGNGVTGIAALSPLADPVDYLGSYRCNQYAHRSFQKLATLVAPELIVISRSPGGRLLFSSNVSSDRPGKTLLAHEGGDRFEREDGGGPVWFVRDAAGRISALSTSSPIFQFERIGLLDDPSIGTGIAVGSILAFSLLGIVGLARSRGGKRNAQGREDRGVRLAVRGTAWIAALNVLTSATFLAFAVLAMNGPRLPVALALGALTLLSTAGLAMATVSVLFIAERRGWLSDRLYVIVGAFVSVAWACFLIRYNLYGIRL